METLQYFPIKRQFPVGELPFCLQSVDFSPVVIVDIYKDREYNIRYKIIVRGSLPFWRVSFDYG